jgi:hypothetical protein
MAIRAKNCLPIFAIIIVLSFFAMSSSLSAGLLANDNNALVRGLRSSDDGVARIEYAVYTKAAFAESFPAIDPSGGAAYEYVYTYQLFNDAAIGSSSYLRALNVGLEGNEQAAHVSEFSVAGAASPRIATAINPPVTSAVWNYTTTNRILAQETSNILLFVSPYAPEWDNCVITSTSSINRYQFLAANDSGVPSPVPEPATMVGVLIAGGMLLFVRKFRSALLG